MPTGQYQQLLTRFDPVGLDHANRADDTDLNYLLESDVGVFLLEQNRVEEAQTYLERLRQGRE